MSAREVRLPVSSSDVHSIATVPDDGGGTVSNTARAASRPIDTPAFMSRTPGPWRRPSRRTIGIRASWPVGHTVSTWPTRSTRGPPLPISSSVWSPASGCASTVERIPAALARRRSSAPQRSTAALSSVGDSMATSASMRSNSHGSWARQKASRECGMARLGLRVGIAIL